MHSHATFQYVITWSTAANCAKADFVWRSMLGMPSCQLVDWDLMSQSNYSCDRRRGEVPWRTLSARGILSVCWNFDMQHPRTNVPRGGWRLWAMVTFPIFLTSSAGDQTRTLIPAGQCCTNSTIEVCQESGSRISHTYVRRYAERNMTCNATCMLKQWHLFGCFPWKQEQPLT